MNERNRIKWPVNTGVHLDEWVDFDNQVHKFYEPLYPGQLSNETFMGFATNDQPPKESQNTQGLVEKLHS